MLRLSIGVFLAAHILGTFALPAQPAPSTPTRPPLPENPPGSIVVEDNDPKSVAYSFAAKATPPHPTLNASGGTITAFAEAKKAGTGDRKVTISAQVPQAGWYHVSLRWSTFMNVVAQYAKKVPAELHGKGGSFSLVLNQQSGNAWVLLGTIELDAGLQTVLELSNTGTDGMANWDALRLVPAAGRPTARPAPPLPAGGDDFSRLARNIVAMEVSNTYGRGDAETEPGAIALAARAESIARQAWDLMMEKPWPTVFSNWMQTQNSASFMLTREAELLRAMAVAYAGASNHLGLDLRGNPELLKATLLGIERFQKRYHPETKWDVNWWDFEIGVPQSIFPAILALGDAVPAEVRKNYTTAAEKFNRDPRKFYNNGSVSTGANRLWMCNAAMLRGTVTRDQELLDTVRDSVTAPLVFIQRRPPSDDPNAKKGPRDGYYEDGSFIQHGGIPYVAAYGYLLLESYALVAECLQGTPWELKAPETANAFRIMEICFDPFVVRGETVQNVVGRSLGAKNYEGNENAANFVVTAARLLPFANPEQAGRLKRLIKKWVTEEPEGALLRTAQTTADAANARIYTVLQDIARDASIQPLPPRTGFEMFANMDVATHRAGNFTVSLGMNSERTITFETIWGANKRGWFQSEGLFLLYTPDVERYRDAYFALIDPYRFPGTMVERFPRAEGDGGGASPGKPGGGQFVGGVALGAHGIAAMHLKPQIGALEARRAWFFLDDTVVCLGAGIGAASEHPVETTVENARVASLAQKFLVDGKPVAPGTGQWPAPQWAWLDGRRPGASIGWTFLGTNPSLNTLLETRKGSRADNNKRGDPAPMTMDFATLWFDHGSGPNNGSYAYAVLPGRSPEETAAFAARPTVDVLANTPEAQAVKDAGRGVTAWTLWKAGTVAGLTTDQPLLVLAHEEAGRVSVALSDPTMALKEPVTVTFPFAARAATEPNERITVKSLSPLTLVFNPEAANGQTQRVVFSR